MIPPALIRLTASHWYWAVAALVVSLVAVILYYRRTVPPLSRRVRFPLIVLRVIAAIALFLTLSDALWSSVREDRRLFDLFVLVDRSASMGRDDDRPESRLKRAEAYFDARIRRPFEGRAEIHRYDFAGQLLEPVALSDTLGGSTALGDAFSALAKVTAEGNPRAVVVLSDGANNRGTDPLEAGNRLRVPIITVGFGDAVGAQGRVVEADAPEVVLTDREFEVTAVLQSGEVDETITLRLSTGGRTIARQALKLEGGGVRTAAVLPVTMSAPGMHDLRLDVVGPDGRAIPTAGRTLFVRALKGRLKVLLIGGVLDWEYAYLKRWLRQQSRIELTSYVAGSPLLDGPAPTRADWSATDVAIFVHPTRRQLNNLWAPRVTEFLSPGRGVVFMLDERFVQATAGPAPFPFEFLRSAAKPVQGEYTLEPLPTRQNHPLVRFDPANDWNQTLEAWTERPPWVRLNCFDTLPGDADVLVRAIRYGSTGDCPAAWVRSQRGGKALVFSGGPLWRWVSDRVLRGEDAREYSALWSNTVRWLSLRDDTDRLAVRTDRQIYHVGEPILLDAAVYDEVYRFLDRAEVTAHVWSDSSTADTLSIFLPPGPGNRFVGNVSHLLPGTYHYDGTAVVDGTEIPLSGNIFRIEPYGLEQQYFSLNEAQLRRMAQETGGRYYPEHNPPAYLDSLDWTASVRGVLFELPLWNQTFLLAVFIAALTVEWFIRRRKQLL